MARRLQLSTFAREASGGQISENCRMEAEAINGFMIQTTLLKHVMQHLFGSITVVSNKAIRLMLALCCTLCFGCDRSAKSSEDDIQDPNRRDLEIEEDSSPPGEWGSIVNSLKSRIVSIGTEKNGDFVKIKTTVEVHNTGNKKVYIPILPPEGSQGTPGTDAKIMIQSNWVSPPVVYPESLPSVLEVGSNESETLKYSVGIQAERMPKSFDLVGIIVSHGKSSSDELWSGKITTGVYSYPASKDSDEVD